MTTNKAQTQVILKITSAVLHLFLSVIFYVLVVMLIVSLSKKAYSFTYQIFGNVAVDSGEGRDVKLKIKSGESTMSIASKLEKSRIIVNKYSFYFRAKLTKQNIKPGTYLVNSAMNYDEIFEVITDTGKNQDENESSGSD